MKFMQLYSFQIADLMEFLEANNKSIDIHFLFDIMNDVGTVIDDKAYFMSHHWREYANPYNGFAEILSIVFDINLTTVISGLKGIEDERSIHVCIKDRVAFYKRQYGKKEN